MDMIDHNRQQGQARRLAEALLAQPDDAACTACLDMLEEFVTAQLAGDDHIARWPEVAGHLDACVACAESYGQLYAARLAAPAAPAALPAPDLSFLQASAAGPLAPAALRDARRMARLREALTTAVTRAGAQLRLTLSQPLLALLPPPTSPALTFRSGADTALFELALDEPGSAIEGFTLSAYIGEQATERCIVRVRVALRGREWPDLAGTPVVLQAGDERRAATTDAWGEAIFEDLPVTSMPDLVVEVDGGA
jgi:hypothetical protein